MKRRKKSKIILTMKSLTTPPPPTKNVGGRPRALEVMVKLDCRVREELREALTREGTALGLGLSAYTRMLLETHVGRERR